MSTLQKLGYTLVGSLFVIKNSSAFSLGKAPGELNPNPARTGEQQVMGLIQTALSFVTFIAVVYVLWAGFKILTGGSDEKAIEQGKKTIINVVIGIVIMWIAYAVVGWVIDSLQKTGT